MNPAGAVAVLARETGTAQPIALRYAPTTPNKTPPDTGNILVCGLWSTTEPTDYSSRQICLLETEPMEELPMQVQSEPRSLLHMPSAVAYHMCRCATREPL